MAAPIAGTAGLAGRGGRIDVQPDFTVAGFPGILVIGDIANIPDKDGKSHPQLGSVALQSGLGRQHRPCRPGEEARSRSPTSTRGRWR
jgi:NADH dehydrogenase